MNAEKLPPVGLASFQRSGSVPATAMSGGVLAVLLLGSMTPVAAQTNDRLFTPRRVVDPMPAIVDAPIVAAERIGDRVHDNELVLGVVVGGQARAYPINMLTGPRREIINDTLGGSAIAATW